MSAIATIVDRTTPHEQLPELLTVSELAAVCGLSEWTVYMNVRTGSIPHVRVGKRILVSKAFLTQVVTP